MDINKRILSQLTREQQIVYTAMMMNPQQIPLFNEKETVASNQTGKVIQEMFKNNVYKSMRLGNDSKVVSDSAILAQKWLKMAVRIFIFFVFWTHC